MTTIVLDQPTGNTKPRPPWILYTAIGLVGAGGGFALCHYQVVQRGLNSMGFHLGGHTMSSSFTFYERGKGVIRISWPTGTPPATVVTDLSGFFDKFTTALSAASGQGGCKRIEFTRPDGESRVAVLRVDESAGDSWRTYLHLQNPGLADASPALEFRVWIARLERGGDSYAITPDEGAFTRAWDRVKPFVQDAAKTASANTTLQVSVP